MPSEEDAYERADRAALLQTEVVSPGMEVCRKMGITEQTFYRWKRKFAGMVASRLVDLPSGSTKIRS